MPPENTEHRKLAAIMFTDMVGYTTLSQRDDKLALELLEEHRQLLRQIFPRFNGSEIKTIGDAFLIEFNSALEAAQCAIEIQRSLAKRNADAPTERQILVRIGIHIGDVVHREGDVYGDGVNIASRIEPLAGAGGICVSMDVERQIRNSVKTRLEKLAPTELKNISVPMELFRIVLPWERQPKAEGGRKKEEVSSSQKSKIAPIGIVVFALVLIGAGWWWSNRANHSTPTPRSSSDELRRDKQSEAATGVTIPAKSIAVLPFENLSDDKSAAYFAEGIQDEILTKLSSVADLKVISRTSTAKYKSKPEDIKTVSQQLRVANVLEGSVQKAADKVRVNVQLVDARADTHLWAKTYDRNLADVFAIQSEVAQEIADSLRAKLTPSEARTMARAPTKDPAAYDLLLKGDYEERSAESTLKPELFDQAATWFRQAIARDPNFALAMAQLVHSQMIRHWFFEPLTEAELVEIKRMADRALTLEPDLAQAHIALGTYYYYGYRQYEQAQAEYERAVQLQPNNADALAYLGYIPRRQGKLKLALEELAKAREQDPRNAALAGNRADIYVQTREWAKSEPQLREVLAIDPHDVFGMRGLLISAVNGSGNVQEALRLLATFPADSKLVVNSTVGDVLGMTGERAYMFVLARDYPAALKVWEGAAITPADERRTLAARVAIRVIAGDLTAAQADAEKAAGLLEQRVRERPDEILSKTELSWVYLAQKRPADAMKLVQQSADLLPPEKDFAVGNHILAGKAMVASQTGAAAEAVAILRKLLSIPEGHAASIARLKIDPVWDPIRNDPGFQELLKAKELIGPDQ